MSNSLTYTVFEIYPSFPNVRWRAVLSDIFTGKVDSTKDFPSETEARDWATGEINSRAVHTAGHAITLPSQYVIDTEALTYLDEAPVRIYGGFGKPPEPEPKPTVPVTCYCCGASIEATHHYDWFTDDLTLSMSHCGKTETRRFTLQQAKQLASIGYLAFMN